MIVMIQTLSRQECRDVLQPNNAMLRAGISMESAAGSM